MEITLTAGRPLAGLRVMGRWSRKQPGQVRWNTCPWVAERL